MIATPRHVRLARPRGSLVTLFGLAAFLLLLANSASSTARLPSTIEESNTERAENIVHIGTGLASWDGAPRVSTSWG